LEVKKQLILPCGSTIQNRIAKSAMSENLSTKLHRTTKEIINTYKHWVKGGAGLIITGNIMVDGRAIAEPRNILVEDKSDITQLRAWASLTESQDNHLWPQINHPGRQAIGFLNKEVVAPSSIKMDIKGMSGMFKKPRALHSEEIEEIIFRFGNTASILKSAGFNGIQIHGAHGYLISQFLSPLTNHRKDKWGGTLENRMRFAIEIYRKIRQNVGDKYPIGIKLNSADFQRGGFVENESMEVVKILSEEGIDLIEISGGTYEKPSMTGIGHRKSTLEREAYFMDYIEKVRKLTETPLMLTGGFRTVEVMEKAIQQNKLDIIGLARPFTLFPNLPNLIFEGKLKNIKLPTPKTGLNLLDSSGFIDIKWHEMQIHLLGQNKKPKPHLSAYSVISHNLKETLKKMIHLKLNSKS